MKNKYFWPNYTAVFILLIWLALSIVFGIIASQGAAEKGNNIPFYVFTLPIFAIVAILLIPMILTFVKVTDNEIIVFKYGFLRCRMKFSEVTEWGIYILTGGRGTSDTLFITTIPTSELSNLKIINKKALKHNKRRFIMLGYDDERFMAFLKEKFPSYKGFLYEKAEYIGSIDEYNSKY